MNTSHPRAAVPSARVACDLLASRGYHVSVADEHPIGGHIDDQGHILAVGERDGRWHDVLLTPWRSRPSLFSPFNRSHAFLEVFHAHPVDHAA